MGEDAVERVATGAAWDDFCERLRSTGQQILAAAPADPFDRAEGLRYLSRLTRHFLKASLEDADFFNDTVTTETPKLGLDNPDYAYFGARLSGGFRYRLRGSMGDAAMIGFGTFSGGLGSKGGLVRTGYLSSDALEIAADGSFEIAVSSEEQPGNWLPMAPETNSLQIRQTLLDRSRQQPAPIQWIRVDGGQGPAPLDPARFSRGLDRAGLLIAGTVGQFLGWTASFRAQGHEIRPIDPELLAFAQGDPNTSYNYAYWELAPEQALEIRFRPPVCEYWNLQIGNHWLESLDFRHHQTHVNHHTAILEPDRSVRILVAREDPGLPNWLDTVGHARGALALRFVGATALPDVHSQVVEVGDLR